MSVWMTQDFRNERDILERYYPAVCALVTSSLIQTIVFIIHAWDVQVKQVSGAQDVFAFDHNVRYFAAEYMSKHSTESIEKR